MMHNKTNPQDFTLFLYPVLNTYDKSLKAIVSSVTNIHFADSDPAWLQVTLPIKYGWLGIRRAEQLAPSTYLASAAISSDLVQHILPSHLQGFPTAYLNDTLSR